MQLKQLLSDTLIHCGNQLGSRHFLSVRLLIFMLFTVLSSNAQTFNWANDLGGSGGDYGQDIAVDGSGNIYVTGYFTGTVDFDPAGNGAPLTTAGSTDIFLAKYDANGGFIWAKALGGKSSDAGQGVVVDGNGNVYVTGYFRTKADFNPGGSGGTLTAVGSADVFLAKYDTSGSFLWAIAMGGSGEDEDDYGNDYGYDVAVDSRGNVYVTGHFNSDTADFNRAGNGGKLTTAAWEEYYNVFLAKYDTSVNFIWAKSLGGRNDEIGQSVAVDGSDNVYITGYFNSSSASFNPGGSGGILSTTGKLDVFLAKYDAGGGFLWAKAMGGSSNDYGQDVAIDGSGNIYLAGYFMGTADFNPGGNGGTLIKTTTTYRDVFLAKYDTSGNFLWVKATAGSDAEGWKVAVDRSSNAYLAGYFSTTTDFNPGGSGGALKSAGSYDIFLAKYAPDGNLISTRAMGGSSGDYGYSIALDKSGNAYLTGIFQLEADFNPGGNGGKLKAVAATDAFVVKFACSDTSSSSLAATIDCGENYILNDSAYTQEGTYIQIFSNRLGCDSTVTLDLTVIPMVTPVVKVDGFTLSVTGTYATYQWLVDGTAITAANDSFYTVTENGIYQVVVTNGKGCSDTSDTYPITNYSAIENLHTLAGHIRIYPNPTTDFVHIQSPVKIKVAITDITGRTIRKTDAGHISLKDLAGGIYLLRITDTNGLPVKTEKVIKK